MFENIAPQKIDLRQWSTQFRLLEDTDIKQFKYYGNDEWGVYLSPPATFMVYGARELKKLKFDNSLSALRLWGFAFNESERLFRARQSGKHIVAAMGDLGTVPVITMSFPECVPFYPDCTWWTPFFNESTVLLDKASELGTPEGSCFVRSTLAAFHKMAYFPKPDILFASTGASCDDYSCIMQMVEDMGYELNWLEIPYRRHRKDYHVEERYTKTAHGFEYPERFETYLVDEYKRVWHKMKQLTGTDDTERLKQSINKNNRLRRLTHEIRELTHNANIAPYPGLEMMVIEFGNLYGYADIDEWLNILSMVKETILGRIEKGLGVLRPDAIPLAWVTPTADPLLLNIVEDLGGRVVATEYVINQALVEIDEEIDPFVALARSFMDASMIGSTEERIRNITTGVDSGKVAGVIISNMLGCSHCAMETRLIEEKLKRVPVLAIDVPGPLGITEQLRTRIAAFLEMLR
ncbi:MAG: 2-hydroxyacyl-CoA dehydratase [candidate division WOR-3 bacterium]|nr:MAG: 2-hydroxyacyl-CoA dehydratase [candidate division WOR-3 bacterium]